MKRSAPAPAWCSSIPALVYEGPGLVARIKRELLACLARDGFATVVGRGIRTRLSVYRSLVMTRLPYAREAR